MFFTKEIWERGVRAYSSPCRTLRKFSFNATPLAPANACRLMGSVVACRSTQQLRGYLCAKENKPQLLNNSSTSVTTDEQLYTQPMILHGMTCPNTRCQLHFPLSRLERGHHSCLRTPLKTSAPTPAPSPLASDALTACAAETSGDFLEQEKSPARPQVGL